MARPDDRPMPPLGKPPRSGCKRALLACGCLGLLLALGACVGFGALAVRLAQEQAALARRLEAAQRRVSRAFVAPPGGRLDEARLLAYLDARDALREAARTRLDAVAPSVRRESNVRLVERRAELLEAAGMGLEEWGWLTRLLYEAAPESLPPATRALLEKHRARVAAARELDWEAIEAQARPAASGGSGRHRHLRDLFD